MNMNIARCAREDADHRSRVTVTSARLVTLMVSEGRPCVRETTPFFLSLSPVDQGKKVEGKRGQTVKISRMTDLSATVRASE